jgi:glycosyltransferase involved in cell wall biosynthesis
MNLGISVIIPTYNNGGYIEQAIESVLAQQYSPCQLIVVDDGSTDGTKAILEPYGDKIETIWQANAGSAAARNRGLQAAKHELILFLDADDLMLPGKLRQQAAFLQLRPSLGYVSSGWQKIDEQGKLLQTVEPWQVAPQLDLDSWLQYKPIQLGAVLFRRIWLDSVGGLDATLRQSHDVDLMLRLSLAGCDGAWLYKPTLQYRQHKKSTMHRNVAVQAESVIALLDKFFARPDIPLELRTDQNKTYFHTTLWLGWYAFINDDEETAVSCLRQNLTVAPTNNKIHTVVEWLYHFINWDRENNRSHAPLDGMNIVFQQAASEIDDWTELERLAEWWQAEQPTAVRQAYTPFDLWRIFQSGLDWERGYPQLTAETILSWWALIWQPYVERRYADAILGWKCFPNLDQFRFLYLVQMGLAAEPNLVNSTQLSLLWQDATAHGLLLEPGFDEVAFFGSLPNIRLPHVSVIVPVYNGALHIVETIEAVFEQTYSDFELLVIDDGSTDGTADLLRSYQGRIRLIQQKNQGVSAARNRGLTLALGEFILFLDSDDLPRRDKLAQQVACLEEDPLLGAVHSGWRLVDAYGRPLREVLPWQQLPELTLPGWLKWKPVFLGAMLFRRSWLRRIDGFRTDLRQAEDTDFLFRLSLAGCPMRWLKSVTIDYRQHVAGVTQNGRQQAVDMSTVLDDFFSDAALPKPIKSLEPIVRQYTLTWLVWQLYRTNYTDDIVTYLQQAVAVVEPQPPAIMAQKWLVQFATYAQNEGLDLAELQMIYPYIQVALQVENRDWPAIEEMLNWWLTHWQLLHMGQMGALPDVQQTVYSAIYLEEAGHIRSSVEWVEWWLKVWRFFLPHENCGNGHEMAAFLDKTAVEVVHLAQGSILYAPHAVEAWQIKVFWYRAQECGLIRPLDKQLVITLYLTFFGQALLGKQWRRARQGLWLAIRFSFQPHALAAWREFIQLGIQYWRNR